MTMTERDLIQEVGLGSSQHVGSVDEARRNLEALRRWLSRGGFHDAVKMVDAVSDFIEHNDFYYYEEHGDDVEPEDEAGE